MFQGRGPRVYYEEGQGAVAVQLADGSAEFLLSPATLRRNDTSATSVNEWTGAASWSIMLSLIVILASPKHALKLSCIHSRMESSIIPPCQVSEWSVMKTFQRGSSQRPLTL